MRAEDCVSLTTRASGTNGARKNRRVTSVHPSCHARSSAIQGRDDAGSGAFQVTGSQGSGPRVRVRVGTSAATVHANELCASWSNRARVRSRVSGGGRSTLGLFFFSSVVCDGASLLSVFVRTTHQYLGAPMSASWSCKELPNRGDACRCGLSRHVLCCNHATEQKRQRCCPPPVTRSSASFPVTLCRHQTSGDHSMDEEEPCALGGLAYTDTGTTRTTLRKRRVHNTMTAPPRDRCCVNRTHLKHLLCAESAREEDPHCVSPTFPQLFVHLTDHESDHKQTNKHAKSAPKRLPGGRLKTNNSLSHPPAR